MTLRTLFTVLVGVTTTLAAANTAVAQHGDIEMIIDGGNLHIELGPEGLLFEGDFEQPPSPLAYFADEPGFEIDDGLATPGYDIGFRVLSELLFFDGASVTSPTDQIEISLAPASIIVTSASGEMDGFTMGTVDAEGGFHQDLEFALQADDGMGGYTAGGATGVYGLHLQMTSPNYGDSQPFLIALNNGLEEMLFEEGAELLAEASGVPVPEPSTLMLSGLAVALVWLGAYRRRRGSRDL